MTRFRYQAVDASGRVKRGNLEAANRAQAVEELLGKGLLPMRLHQRWIGPNVGAFDFPWHKPDVSRAEKAIFTRQMATLLSSGIQIEAALAAIAAQSPLRLGVFCRTLRETVMDGGTLSNALARQNGRFDRFYVTSVRSGEQSGRLGAVFEHLASHVESAERHRQTVTLALIYPAILVAVSAAVVVALLVFVLPDIVRVFAARGAELPPLTRVMIAISDLVARSGLLFVAGIAALIIGAIAISQRPNMRVRLHALQWRIGFVRQIVLVQYTGTLSALTQSGVTLTDALSAATATVSNLEARAQFTAISRDVREGMALSRALAARRGFPPMMITMVASGEASGTLPAMLGRFWQDQSDSLQARVKTLVGLVEPLVLLIMGGVVMLLVLAILLPIVNLNTLVG